MVSFDYTDPHYRMGTIYIGVYGWQNTTFSILASVTDLSRNDTVAEVTLINGIPQIGFLDNARDTRSVFILMLLALTVRAKHSRYRFFLGDAHNDVTFTVTPRYGDPDMYIRNDGKWPTPTFYQWSSRQWGRDQIFIPDSCIKCNYTILVEAYTHTLYSIVAVTDFAHTVLESGTSVRFIPRRVLTITGAGISVTGTVRARKFNYYVINVDRWDDELVIALNAIGSGDPDLYISDSDDNMWYVVAPVFSLRR